MPVNLDLPALEQRRDSILAELQTIGDMRRGSLVHRYMQCSTPTCRCHQDRQPRHGPYFMFVCHVNGKRTSRSLPKAAAARVQAQLDEYRRFRRLSSDLLAINEQLCDARLPAEAVANANKTVRRNSPARSKTKSSTS